MVFSNSVAFFNIFLFESSLNSATNAHRKTLKSKSKVVIIRNIVKSFIVAVEAKGVSFKIEFK